MKLKLGKMSSREIAAWLGLSYNTYKNHINKYLAQLDLYCQYEVVYGGIIVKEIYTEEYDKNGLVKDQQIYLDEIKECVKTQDGLATLSGLSRKLFAQGIYASESTARRRLTKVGNDLFGITKDLTSHGEAGSREYIWAIKLNDFNKYRLMTPEEEKRFDEIITSLYTSNADRVKKAALLENALRTKTINSDEYFEQIDRLGLNVFQDCIFKFRDETGYTIVHCTKHELYESLAFERE